MTVENEQQVAGLASDLNRELDALMIERLRKAANRCTRLNADVALLCEAALAAANMIEKKLLIPLPVDMWGETHEERYCKTCGMNMCNHFWMASRGGGYVVCPT